MTRPVLRRAAALAALALLAGHAPQARGQDAARPSAEVERWLRDRLVPLDGVEPSGPTTDLRPLGSIVGDARVVAFGEVTHGAHEPLAFRNRLFRWLVEERGFTAIALESGLPESQALADFVAGGPGAPPAADAGRLAQRHLTWGFGNFAENVELLRWMRAWNDDPAHRRKLRLYGIDLSLGGPQGSTPTPSAIESALRYLARVDSAAAPELRRRFAPLIRFLPGEPGSAPMSDAQHDSLTTAIDALHARLARRRADYVARSSERDYAWALRCAEVARQADRVHRVQAPPSPTGGIPRGAWREIDARDSAMAENVVWALGREGDSAGLLIFAHDVHVKSAPTVGGPWRLDRPLTAMGQRLRATLGDRLVVIGSVGGARAGAASATIDAAFAGVGVSRFAIDLRSAQHEAVRRWLAAEQTLRVNDDAVITLRPRTAFDALVYLDSLTPARKSVP